MASRWGSEVEQERRNRILVAVAAWAYEEHNSSFMSDASFDALALSIRPKMRTGNKALDAFFLREFDPCTGQWVHKHPDKAGLERLWRRYYRALGSY